MKGKGFGCLGKYSVAHSNPFPVLALAISLLSIFPLAARPNQSVTGRIVLYLEIPQATGKDVAISLLNPVLLGSKEGQELRTDKQVISSIDNAGDQILLAEKSIPIGHYSGLKFLFNRIVMTVETTKTLPSFSEQGIMIPLELDIHSGEATAVFLHWDPSQDQFNGKVYAPSIHLKTEGQIPTASTAFVSNSKSDYITCIDRFRKRVVGVIGVGQEPKDMVFAANRQELYVANSGSDDLSVIDIHSNRETKSIRFRTGDQPSRMALSADQRRLFVVNSGSNSVSVVDLLSSQEEKRIHLDAPPAAVMIDYHNNVIYVASQESDRLFAIDPNTFSIVQTMGFGANLDEMGINRSDRKLFLVKSAQRQVTILDIVLKKQEGNLNLCGPATGLAYLRSSGTLFASIPDCSSISIFKPSGKLDIGVIHLPAVPGKIVLDPESKTLMVTFPEGNRIGFYNANSWEHQAYLEVGASPFTISFAQ